jgi:hypothetical protein
MSDDELSETGVTIMEKDGLDIEVPYRASYRFGGPRRITKKSKASW